MYRSVNELNESELNELRSTLYYQLYENGTIDIDNDIEDAEDITDDMLYKHYDGICFVKDDFFCNQ